MVKLPSLDELKKMGSDLMEQAKNVKFGEMVDKVKSGIESVSTPKTSEPTSKADEDSDVSQLFSGIYASLAEITHIQVQQKKELKKIETQLAQLAKLIANKQQPSVVVPEDKEEEKHG
jgi:hypothetical protein